MVRSRTSRRPPGSNTATDTRFGRAKFRQMFTCQLGYVLTVYPAARVDVGAEGLVVYPARRTSPAEY